MFQDSFHSSKGLNHVCSVVVKVPQFAIVSLMCPPERVLLQNLKREIVMIKLSQIGRILLKCKSLSNLNFKEIFSQVFKNIWLLFNMMSRYTFSYSNRGLQESRGSNRFNKQYVKINHTWYCLKSVLTLHPLSYARVCLSFWNSVLILGRKRGRGRERQEGGKGEREMGEGG